MRYNYKKTVILFLGFGILMIFSLLVSSVGISANTTNKMTSDSFTVFYHLDDSATRSEQATTVTYGVNTATLTTADLGFEKQGKLFAGWKVYRSDIGCWRVKDSSGNQEWSTYLPDGYEYSLYNEGAVVARTASVGSEVHFYAQWKDDYFTIKYHEDSQSQASDIETHVTYGVNTETLSAAELNFAREGKVLSGWYVYRDDTHCWRVQDEAGNQSWKPSLEEGDSYVLYITKTIVAKTVPAGETVHFYGQWVDNFFTVYYHSSLNSAPSAITTKIVYGNDTKTLTAKEVGLSNGEYVCSGWIAQRAGDGYWRITNGETSKWSKTKEEGYEYVIYPESVMLSKTVSAGDSLHFYAQWTQNSFEVKYHQTDTADASEQVTIAPRGEHTVILSIQELGFSQNSSAFIGWRAQRESDGAWCIIDVSTKELVWTTIIDNDSEYKIFEDRATVTATVPAGDTVHFYGQWISSDINVTDTYFGADGTDNRSDYRAIQKALDLGKSASTDSPITVSIPAGNYYIDDTLWIYSNTTLNLSAETTIIRTDDSKLMLQNGLDIVEQTNGYKQLEHVSINGGIWNGNVTNRDENGNGTNAKNLFYFWHGSDISVSNTLMKECCGNHFIELAAIANCVINKVTFQDFVRYSGTDYSYIDGGSTELNELGTNSEASDISEAIQLDYAGETTSTAAVPYDNSPCQNITISECAFNNCMSGIGTHHSDVSMHTVNIIDNSFYNMDAYCFNLTNMVSVIVNNNTANKIHGVLYAISGSDATLSNNIMNYDTDRKTEIMHMIYCTDSKIELSGNTINGSDLDILHAENSSVSIKNNSILNAKKSGINIKVSSLIAIDNTITGSGKTGIYVNGGMVDIRNNTISKSGDFSIKITDNVIADYNSTGIVSDNTVYVQPIEVVNTVQTKDNVIEGEITDFTILYHEDDKAEAEPQITKVTYGVSTKTLTINELKYSTVGRAFEGWKVYREYDQTWRVIDASGKQSWGKTVPTGGNYYLYKNGANVAATSPAGTVVHFYAQWHDTDVFTIQYHNSESATASSQTSNVVYGISTRTLTISDLKYSTIGRSFLGWKVYREYDQTWRVVDVNGKQSWAKAVPNGGNYYLYQNGANVAATSPTGTTVHFYAQWETTDAFTIKYHNSDSAAASSQTSKVTYGVSTKTFTINDLKYSTVGQNFLGWKVYREYDQTWRVIDANGKQSWAKTMSNGGNYYLYQNGANVAATSPAGTTVHFYAQWESTDKFTIQYHDNDGATASAKISKVIYGSSTKTLTINDLNYSTIGRVFKGWKVYREYDQTWRVIDANGKQSWAKTVPVGGDYYLYKNGANVAATSPAGTTVHFYAQWEDTDVFTIQYHKSDNAVASTQISKITYGVSTKTLTVSTLKYITEGQTFLGWKVYREYDKTWRVIDKNGKQSWAKTVPNGGNYYLYPDGANVAATSPAGTTVHFYAQWDSVL